MKIAKSLGASGAKETKQAAETAATPAPAPAAPVVDNWTAYITPFASTIGKPVADVTNALKGLVGESGDSAIALLQNEDDTPTVEIKDALKGLGVPTAVLNKAIKGLRKAEQAATSAGLSTGYYDSVLPILPDDESFVQMLRTGGILKPGNIEVICAIRAALASSVGLYDLPSTLLEKMEAFAEDQSEPCGAEYYTLRKMITRKSYGEIFEALNIDGASITQKKKDQLLGKLKDILWPVLSQFNQKVISWVNMWQQGAANPGALMTAMASMMSGGRAGMPVGMMQPPQTTALRTGAEDVIDKINKVFAGTGIVTARALAYDANNIKAVLTNPALPSQIGAANREQMLKMLHVDVSSDYVLLEQNITRYALALMNLPNVTSGDAEVAYLSAMFQLGNAIPWDKLESQPVRNSRI